MIQIKRLEQGKGLPLPSYTTEGAAGADIVSAVDCVLGPGERTLVPTGFSVAIPPGYEIQVRPRSGLALKQGITVLNSPGTVDSDYRGELKVILINHGKHSHSIARGERIAQLIVASVANLPFVEVTELNETDRGHGGFGSTGR